MDSKLEAKTAKVDGSLPNGIWRGVEARATPERDFIYLNINSRRILKSIIESIDLFSSSCVDKE